MAKLKLELPDNEYCCTGKHISFRVPCDYTRGISHIQVSGEDYALVDSTNSSISCIFYEGAILSVILDKENYRAYIMNSSYIKRTGYDIPPLLNNVPQFTFSDSSGYTFTTDSKNNWTLTITKSGTLKFTDLGSAIYGVDMFMIGGGGAGHAAGGSGGGGYSSTKTNLSISSNENYTMTVGAGGSTSGADGGQSYALGYRANGGKGGSIYSRVARAYLMSGGNNIYHYQASDPTTTLGSLGNPLYLYLECPNSSLKNYHDDYFTSLGYYAMYRAAILSDKTVAKASTLSELNTAVAGYKDSYGVLLSNLGTINTSTTSKDTARFVRNNGHTMTGQSSYMYSGGENGTGGSLATYKSVDYGGSGDTYTNIGSGGKGSHRVSASTFDVGKSGVIIISNSRVFV